MDQSKNSGFSFFENGIYYHAHTKKSLARDIDILQLFKNKIPRSIAHGIYEGETGYNQDSFYKRVKKLEKASCLIRHKGKSIDSFLTNILAYEALSGFLGEIPEKDKVPREFPRNGGEGEIPEKVLKNPVEKFPLKIRTHNINVKIPIQISKADYRYLKLKGKPFFRYNAKAGNLANLQSKLHNKKEEWEATIQIFPKTCLIRISEIWGKDVFSNIGEIHRRVQQIIKYYNKHFPYIKFEEVGRWTFPKENTSIYGLEHALPGYPVGEGEYWVPVGDEGDEVGWDHSAVKLEEDDSAVKIGELETRKGNSSTENMEKIVNDIKWTLENGIGTPELNNKIQTVSSSVETQTSQIEDLASNVETQTNHLENLSIKTGNHILDLTQAQESTESHVSRLGINQKIIHERSEQNQIEIQELKSHINKKGIISRFFSKIPIIGGS